MSQALKSLEELYLAEKYDEALNLLKTHKAELSEGLYHYNLGSIYAKSGQLPQARYHLELAKKLQFATSKVEHNLAFVRKELGLLRVEEPKALDEYFKLGVEQVSPQWFFSIFLLLVLAGLLLYRKTKNIFVMASFLVLAMLPFFVSRYFNQGLAVAVVEQNAPMYEGPSDVFEQSGEVPGGLKLYLSELREGNWYFVEYPKSFRGWVQKRNLNFIRGL